MAPRTDVSGTTRLSKLTSDSGGAAGSSGEMVDQVSCQVSGVKCLVSGVKCQVQGVYSGEGGGGRDWSDYSAIEGTRIC